jgi:hypothetical protein
MFCQTMGAVALLFFPRAGRPQIGIHHQMAVPVTASIQVVNASLPVVNMGEAEQRIIASASEMVGMAREDVTSYERRTIEVAKVIVAVIGSDKQVQ